VSGGKKTVIVLVWACLKLALLFSVALAGQISSGSRSETAEVFQGALVRIRFSGPDLVSVTGFLRAQKILFFPETKGSYSAFVGVDLEEKPGPLPIRIQSVEPTGKHQEVTLTLQVREKKFAEEHLSVAPKFDLLDAAHRKRIDSEQERLNRLWMLATPVRLWEGHFLPPVPGEVTAPFGRRRIVNGLPRAPHSGVDLRAALGTPITAPNHGRVVLRDQLFFGGNSLVLDHGGGLYTMYFHLSDFGVAENVLVRKGEILGWAGMSGRVTGPHLHWGTRLNGARIDPQELLDKVDPEP
jgi:hypothetical protein